MQCGFLVSSPSTALSCSSCPSWGESSQFCWRRSPFNRTSNHCHVLCVVGPMQRLTSTREPCWPTPSPVRCAYTRGCPAFSWAGRSWLRPCRRTAAITCSIPSSWSTPTPSPVSFHPVIHSAMWKSEFKSRPSHTKTAKTGPSASLLDTQH